MKKMKWQELAHNGQNQTNQAPALQYLSETCSFCLTHGDKWTLKAILHLVLSAQETPNKSQDEENTQKVFFLLPSAV